MSIFIGSNAGETIEPGFVSSTVAVIGNPKTPSGAADIIFAGSGNDRVAGGGGNDIAFLGAGDDLYTWNSGDGNDLVDGGSGSDTLAFNGSAAAETIKLSTGILGTTRVSTSAENGSVTSTGVEHIVVSAGAGDDVVDASALPAGHATLEIFGGLGNDLLIGSAGNDVFNGGDGNDTALMGAGNDTFVWNPGDDNDIVEGQAGFDTMLFNGANIAEVMDVSANGSRTLFTRNIGAITMDLNDVERIDVNALGGADKVTVNDLSGTDVTEVNVNLAGTLGGATGDAAADQVIVNGTAGNDTIQASSDGTSATVLGLAAVTNVTNLEAGIDQLIVDGQGGNDTLIGGAGSQILHGGEGNDLLRGGDGDDQMFGDAGNDRMVWNPGDDSDLMEGGDGTDTAEVNGGNAGENFTATANGTRVRFDRIDPGPFNLDIGTTEELVVNMNGGDDQFSATGNLSPLIHITVDGGDGNDTILGGNGADLLIGGDGNDFIDGNQGNDTALMGAGEDTFQWDPGDGSDIVEGQAGFDTMLFNGANIAEVMDVSANGSRTLFTRNIGNITMDLNDVERIDVNALGGADVITVHDLRGTDVTQVNVNLGAIGGAGDAAADQVIVEATSGNDSLQFTGGGATASVIGLGAITNVSNAEVTDQFIVDGLGGNDVMSASLDQAGAPTLVFEGGDGEDTAQIHGSDGDDTFAITANGTRAHVDAGNLHLDVGTTESLVIDAGDGNDSISAVGNLAALTKLTLDGGAGDDTIRGGNGADLLIGGDGNDFIDGNQGNDTALMGAGDDTFQWDPGDGSDIVEGQAGFDTMLFNGANIAEVMDVSANGSRTLFTRNIGNIAMDLNDVERIDVTALGGADNVVVNDLSGTDVTEVNVNLAANGGGGDGSADVVTVNATSGDDVAVISGDASGLSVLGLAAQLNITGAEGALDQLHVNGGAGDDVIDASGVAAGSIGLVLDGGEGNDIILGSAGDDILIGGPGDDVIIGGGGNDTIIAAPGADTVIQGFAAGAGSDDVIDLRGIAGAQDFAWVMAHASDVDGNAVLDLGGEHVTIENVAVASFHSDDFLLGS